MFGVISWLPLLSLFVGKRSASMNSGARVNSKNLTIFIEKFETLESAKVHLKILKSHLAGVLFLKKKRIFDLV